MPDMPLIAGLEPLPALPDLQRLWEGLSTVANASFFTSWDWIEAWLQELHVDAVYRLMRVQRGDTTIAAGIFVAW